MTKWLVQELIWKHNSKNILNKLLEYAKLFSNFSLPLHPKFEENKKVFMIQISSLDFSTRKCFFYWSHFFTFEPKIFTNNVRFDSRHTFFHVPNFFHWLLASSSVFHSEILYCIFIFRKKWHKSPTSISFLA